MLFGVLMEAGFFSLSDRSDAFSGASETNPTVAPEGHGVGVGWVHACWAVRQLHRLQSSFIISAHALVRLDEGRVQDWLLQWLTGEEKCVS